MYMYISVKHMYLDARQNVSYIRHTKYGEISGSTVFSEKMYCKTFPYF